MVRHRWKTDSTKKYRLVIANLGEAIIGHHLPVFDVVIAAPGLLIELKLDIEFAARRLQYPDTFGNNFFTDAITRNNGDFVFAQGSLRLN